MNRRDALTGLAAAGAGGFLAATRHTDEAYAAATNGLKPLKITKVTAIPTCPHGIELVVVKVETDEPGLYGLGCATFRQRALAVVTAVNDYLDDFCRGRDAENIEDLWQTAYVSSYWRNGPVLNNALSGVDQALWDIKGKRAGMPVYQLLGGKCRFAVDTYAHAGGSTPEQAADNVKQFMAEGYRHVRIQLGGYGSTHLSEAPDFKEAGFGMPGDNHMDARPYLRSVPKMFEAVRVACGEDIDLLHDIHERVQPLDAINLIRELEQYRPFFIEDPFAPEDNGWFELLRKQTSCPIAMGELFNNPHEWTGLIANRLIDFIRVHISQIGGITPARKIAALAECFNVRTAWHGPGDVSPVGHAANCHLDLAVWNFGIQERVTFSDTLQNIFPGCPRIENGYLFVNEAPGLGVDIDEKLALKFPLPAKYDYGWTQVRRGDGTAVRP